MIVAEDDDVLVMADRCCDLGQRIWPGQPKRKHALPSVGSPERALVGPDGCHPDRQRLLNRSGFKPDAAHVVVLSCVMDRGPAPKGSQQLQALVKHCRTPRKVGFLTELAVFGGAFTADPNTKYCSPVTQPVERRGLTRHVPWSAARQRSDHGTQANVARRLSRDSQRHPGFDRRLCAPLVDNVTLKKPAIPAGCFGSGGQLSQ